MVPDPGAPSGSSGALVATGYRVHQPSTRHTPDVTSETSIRAAVDRLNPRRQVVDLPRFGDGCLFEPGSCCVVRRPLGAVAQRGLKQLRRASVVREITGQPPRAPSIWSPSRVRGGVRRPRPHVLKCPTQAIVVFSEGEQIA